MAWWRDIAYGVGAAVSSPVWGYALIKTGKWRTDWAGRFGKVDSTFVKQAQRASERAHEHEPSEKSLSKKNAGKKRILIHAVSVGEANAIRHLVSVFEAQVPDVELVISATTNTGYARAVSLYGERANVVGVVRYPFDFSCAVERFLDGVEPDLAVLVELELWPNFAEACERRDIPLAVVNGRLSERSFKRYKLARPFVASTFARVAAAGVQTQAYADRFIAMGTEKECVHVLDTMKWDTAVVAQTVEGSDELAASLGLNRSRPIVVAGSTGPGEEAVIVEAVRSCGVAGVQLVLAPRKPERFDAVAKLFDGCTRRSEHADEKRTEHQTPDRRANHDVFLLDTMGELRKAYALADLCLVGRSWMGDLYGSDMMEPIALGRPTLIGPYFGDFTDTVEALRQGDGIEIVEREDLAEAIARLLNDPAAASRLAAAGRDVILKRRGATKRHVDMLLDLLGS